MTNPLAEDALVKALALVNRYRDFICAKPVKEMPAGVRHTSSRDPISRATGAVWVDSQYTTFIPGAASMARYAACFGPESKPHIIRSLGERCLQINTPPAWRHFLAYFDAGFYPDLVEPR